MQHCSKMVTDSIRLMCSKKDLQGAGEASFLKVLLWAADLPFPQINLKGSNKLTSSAMFICIVR